LDLKLLNWPTIWILSELMPYSFKFLFWKNVLNVSEWLNNCYHQSNKLSLFSAISFQLNQNFQETPLLLGWEIFDSINHFSFFFFHRYWFFWKVSSEYFTLWSFIYRLSLLFFCNKNVGQNLKFIIAKQNKLNIELFKARNLVVLKGKIIFFTFCVVWYFFFRKIQTTLVHRINKQQDRMAFAGRFERIFFSFWI